MEDKQIETLFPFEEGGVYYDRIFPFTARKVTLPLKIAVFDSLCIIPVEVLPDKKQVPYMAISIGRLHKTHGGNFSLTSSYGGGEQNLENWKLLYGFLDQFWKMGPVYDESVVEKWREELVAFCKEKDILVYEYIAVDRRNEKIEKQ